MNIPAKPAVRPADPRFSSGPTKKRPGWTTDALAGAVLGRSHRAKAGKARLKEAIDRTRAILGVPADFKIGIVPASDTGAIEMAMWSMLGARPVDIFAWESFGEEWVTDAKQLKLDFKAHTAGYGALPDLRAARKTADIIFTQNGTTSGVRIPNFDWIAPDREGITINDATSAVFAQQIDWAQCDVTTFSWQKVLGGEGAHGMLILSQRAIARLESYMPDRPLPKIFRLTKKGKVDLEIFEGSTINTPSLLATEDYIDALKWAESIGGLEALRARADANTKAIADWVARTDWVDFLAEDAATRSNTSVCLKVVNPRVTGLSGEGQAEFAKKLAALLEKEGVALDVGSYRSAPPGLRIWCGGTVEAADVEALTPWLDWAFATLASDLAQAA
ncbi:MAG TPA: phosphoserine transaminase [Vitreimonas sp.]|uniref:phosphoserine transaminase n=1 Tax=Vitreimonas sp. TaxID=3069702 RepID=UPI002D630E3F|nr:phosphoserine transaminase [Vitreimonas sp.]HYD86951.1 phosphoserine transaminase [Vitreimonas sp.]